MARGGKAKHALFMGAGACLAFAAAPAQAQPDAGEQPQARGDSIVVTARRRTESLIDVPIAMTTQSAEQLDLRGATDITALQRVTPNLTLQVSRGTNSTLTAFIRGVGQQDPLWGFEPGVGLYVDDVYIARPQGAILDIFDIERIEVLRGPQGTLYGRNTIGGAVKYVTARIGDEPKFSIRTNFGTYQQADVIASASAPINDLIAIGGSVAYYSRNGYGENVFTGADTNNKDVFAARATLEATPSDTLYFRFSADRTEDDSNANHGHREVPVSPLFAGAPFNVPAECLSVLESKYDTCAGIGDNNEVITQGVSALAEWTVNEQITLKSISAYRDGVTHSKGIDFDNTPAPLLDVAVPESVYADHQFSQELQVLYEGDRLQGVFGAYYLNSSASGAFDTILAAAGLTQGTSGNVDTRSYAIFGDVSIDVIDRVSVSLGGRWTRDEKLGTVFKANYLSIGSPITGVPATPVQILTDYTAKKNFEEFTPRVSISYALADDVNVYAAYSKGFKSGGFDMRGDASATPATQEGYEPETVNSYEIGLKGLFFDRRLQLAGAVFRASYDGQQVTTQQVIPTGTGVVSFVDNVGSSTITGFELEGMARLTDALSLNFGVGYVDAGFDEYLAYIPNAAPPPLFVQEDVSEFRQFQNTPAWNGNVSATYERDLGAAGVLTLIGAMSFRSDVNLFETPIPAIDQPAYQLFDADLVWTSANDHWRVGVHARNLSDERYRTGGYNFPGLVYGDSVIGFYAPPRTVFVSLEARY
ncbi:MAG: TonB-dependent receptor [Pseudomonadota bacterium]|nr:TonB-dependent receptor [Pseudomonadota bacterium]